MYITTYLVFKLMFSRSQNKWECDLNGLHTGLPGEMAEVQ